MVVGNDALGPVMRPNIIAKKHVGEEACLPHDSKETLGLYPLQGRIPGGLTSFCKAPPLKGFTTSHQHLGLWETLTVQWFFGCCHSYLCRYQHKGGFEGKKRK